MKSTQKVIHLFLIAMIFLSCKEYETDLPEENCVRISKITQYNKVDDWLRVHSFTYEKERLKELTSCFLDENNELREFRKITFEYDDQHINVDLLKLHENTWYKHQGFEFKTCQNRIMEKLISRFSLPDCSQCWKYTYEYQGKHLAEIKKYIKGNTGNWELDEARIYKYENEVLAEDQWFVNSGNGAITLDYLYVYSHNDNHCQSCVGGLVRLSNEWVPAQKMEYVFAENCLRSKKCYKLNAENQWNMTFEINFSYDLNGRLTEEINSRGGRTFYDYETGKGNSHLFLDDPTECIQPGFLYF